jgi:hypothetical protein
VTSPDSNGNRLTHTNSSYVVTLEHLIEFSRDTAIRSCRLTLTFAPGEVRDFGVWRVQVELDFPGQQFANRMANQSYDPSQPDPIAAVRIMENRS